MRGCRSSAPIDDSPGGTTGAGRENRRLLEDVCRAASFHLGAYDSRILVWLTTFELSIVAMIAGSRGNPRLIVISDGQ